MPTSHVLKHLAVHLLTPLLMCLGMALAYQGAFHQPEPRHLKVAIVGATPEARVLAQTVKDRAGDALDVTTVASAGEAREALADRELVGAFVPDARHPEVLIAKANSETSAMAAEAVFQAVAAKQGVPLAVTDVKPTGAGDPTGQGIFFLLVTLSIGSYGSATVLNAGAARLSMRMRAGAGLAASFAVSVIGIVTAGPVFGVVDHAHATVWALGWLYSAGVVAFGLGLHAFLKQWTTLALMVLFVMLNFTSSGGIYRPDLQNGFFGALHSFYTGAGFVEGVRDVLYFGGGIAGRVLTLALWLAAGALLMVAAAARERRAHAGRQAAVPAAAQAAVAAA
ncbi:hypothetical protein ACFQLX_14320 [Streptomyces polyrhachis]|uniref:ABC transporter permease n=1 Tax=Streptomyces polyrhachis TaxID=1282885 RepID=A0ABW2GIH5_9ACTN